MNRLWRLCCVATLVFTDVGGGDCVFSDETLVSVRRCTTLHACLLSPDRMLQVNLERWFDGSASADQIEIACAARQLGEGIGAITGGGIGATAGARAGEAAGAALGGLVDR